MEADFGVTANPGQPLFAAVGPQDRSRDEDERDLIRAARQRLASLKSQKRLSRLEKGALADRVLHAAPGEPTFAQRLGALLRKDTQHPMPTVTVEFRGLRVEADALVGSAANPSVANAVLALARTLTCQRAPTSPHTILDGVSGVLRPSVMTLLLGPPSGGKTVLLGALSGRLRSSRSLRISGSIKYNGLPLDQFQPRRTAGLVAQNDCHIADLTVLETVEFAYRCQLGPEQREALFARLEAAQQQRQSNRHLRQAGDACLAAAEGGGSDSSGSKQKGDGRAAGDASAAPSGRSTASKPAKDASSASMRSAASRAANEAADGNGRAAALEQGGGVPTAIEEEGEEDFAEVMQEVVGQRILPHLVLRMMGLAHAAQTLVGSSEQRGISGGERKRLTTAEIIVGQQPVVFMDEISTGLDSATAYSVIKTFRDVSHALSRTFLISLLQPAPEVIHLFDEVLLLTDGRVIYHGPVDGVLQHFESRLHFVCPTRKDPGSFLQEVTTPAGQWLYADEELLKRRGLKDADRAPAALLAAPPTRLLTPLDEMHRVFWQQTEQGQAILRQLEKEPFQPTEAARKAVQTEPYGNTSGKLVKEVVRRQFLLNVRMKSFYIARVIQTTLMAIIISTLFATIEPTPQDGRNAVALCVLSAIFLSMNSAPQLAFAQLAKPVFYKQRDSHLFPPWAYSLAQVVTQLPQSTVEALCFSSVCYWISGLTRTASNFFIYLLIAWSSSNCLAGLFRMIGYFGRDMVTANSSAMLILLLMVVTNGFSIVRPSIPPYLLWLYWINPLSWSIRALVINELTAPRWQYEVAPGVTAGDTIMQPFGFPPDRSMIWGAIGFLWGALIVYTVSASLALRYTQPPAPRPTVPEAENRKETTRRILARLQRQLRATGRSQFVQNVSGTFRRILGAHDEPADQSRDEEAPPPPEPAASGLQAGGSQPPAAAAGSSTAAVNGHKQQEAVELATLVSAARDSESSSTAALRPRLADIKGGTNGAAARPAAHERVAVPFTPITLVCRDLRYYVDDSSHGEARNVVRDKGDHAIAGKLELLRGVSFYCVPGDLTALMGGSGAGKTTLMDCVLGRKTVGLLRGDILVNGFPKAQSSWARVCGYVEQQDIHSARSTVRESLEFSARLRLSKDIPLNKVHQLVNDVLEMTELSRLQHSIVGEGDGGQGLSVEQRKRLSIAVELVAAPAVVFLDEPTSGLDARAAAIVMRTIQNVAKSNRTVVVTIHQPSTEVFESFDQLLLMQLGGRLSFFGPMGSESASLIAYLQAQPGVEPIRPGSNPATWMLEVTGGSMCTIYTTAEHLDFPAVYEASELRARNDETAERLVAEGLAAHAPLTVPSQFAASFATQRCLLLKKFVLVYWRSPSYNFTRVAMTALIAGIYAMTYHGQGNIEAYSPANIGNVQNILGLLFSTSIFLGMFNAMSVQPLVSAERIVFYRERAAMLYSPGPYSLALGLAEVPYLLVQALVMVNIVYWSVHFAHVGWKYAYFFLLYILALAMYTLTGQFLVAATPNPLMAQLLTASLNQLWTISNGFLIPYPDIPRAWKWLNRISPTTYILMGLGSSQLGDSEVPMVVFTQQGSQTTTVSNFLAVFFGWSYSFIWWCQLIIFGYALFFRLGFSLLLRFVNYQRR